MGWTDLSHVLLLFPSLALARPCWLPGSNVVLLVRSSPTLRYLLNCGYLTTKPAILSTHGEYFPDEVAGGMIRMQTAFCLARTGEEGGLEMLVVKEGKCLSSEEDLPSHHKTYITLLEFKQVMDKDKV